MCILTSDGILEISIANSSDNLVLSSTSKLMQSGMTYHHAGDFQRASALYKSILKIQAQHHGALHLLGVIELQTENYDNAVSLINKAIKGNPDKSQYYNNCGEAFRRGFQFDSSLVYYEKALEVDPSCVAALNNKGLALHSLGQPSEALTCYEQAQLIHPHSIKVLNNMGVVLYNLDRFTEALTCFKKSLSIDPYSSYIHNNMGVVLKALSQVVKAIVHHQTAMRLNPDNLLYQIAFAKSINWQPITQASDALIEDLVKVFSSKGINHQEMAFACANLLKHDPRIQELMVLIEKYNEPTFRELYMIVTSLLQSTPLFLVLLKKVILRDPMFEKILTKLRGAILLKMTATGFAFREESELCSIVYALSHQCFSNEYVFSVSEIEQFEFRKLKQRLLSGIEHFNQSMKIQIAIVACYCPLSDLGRDEELVHLLYKYNDTEFDGLIVRQVVEPREEKQWRDTIDKLGTLQDNISKQVRNQYEENPYPRWLETHKIKRTSLAKKINKLFPQFPLEHHGDIEPIDILIAGCGTGKQVVDRSLEFPSANIIGVDISMTSLAYAKRKAYELNIHKAKFIQVDILNLHLLNASFNFIECIGVLHHMNDPVAGWQVLANHLRAGALMRVGLYSKKGRTHITAAQKYVAEVGYTTKLEDIQECRQYILTMPITSTLGKISCIVDFYTTSETRDLLFHVQEKCFTLLQISDILRTLRLTFVGFEFDDPQKIRKYLDRFPYDPTATSLQNWHLYEQDNPDTFIGLYVFWVQKSYAVL